MWYVCVLPCQSNRNDTIPGHRGSVWSGTAAAHKSARPPSLHRLAHAKARACGTAYKYVVVVSQALT
jgi:hypothetical protein